MIGKILKQERILILILFLIGLTFRLINYKYFVNFSTDQALFSSAVLEIIENKKPVLIGPPTGINIDGRHLFSGPFIYYSMTPFLFFGKWDPYASSLLFTIFSTFSVVLLYYGIKWLINRNAALIIAVIWSLVPYFINYSRFIWNPNLQLTFTNILIFLLGYFRVKNLRIQWLIIPGFLWGIVFQMHYQYLVTSILLLYLIKKTLKIRLKGYGVLITGFILGMMPLIIFEFRHNFYFLNTLIFLADNLGNNSNSGINIGEISHYFLSITLTALILLLLKLKHYLTSGLAILLSVIFIFSDSVIYIPKPDNAFRNASFWNLPVEERAHAFIANNIRGKFNVTNLVYDTKAEVQKYLLKKENIIINEENYTDNEYLFVISGNENFTEDNADEIRKFLPAQTVKSEDLNGVYKIFLLKRI